MLRHNTKRLQERDYQSRAREKVITGFRSGLKSQLIVAPTGSGKTAMAMSSIGEMVHRSTEFFGVDKEEVGVAWVTMRRNNLHQAEKENAALYSDNLCGPWMCENMHYISMFSHPDNVRAEMDRYRIKILIADEAHHDATSSAIHVYNAIDPNFVLGLSATPQRHDSLKICFQREIRDASYRQLVEEGWLSKFNHWSMNEWSPESAARTYLAAPQLWGQSLMFFLNTHQCMQAASILRDNGIRVEVVTGKSDRDAQIDQFENREVDVIVSMAVLTEGFDCPQLKSVFVRDTYSKGNSIQMSGRALRLYGGWVKNIVQSKNAIHPFVKFARPKGLFVQKDNGKWESLTPSDLAEKTSTRVMVSRLKNPIAGYSFSKGVSRKRTNRVANSSE